MPVRNITRTTIKLMLDYTHNYSNTTLMYYKVPYIIHTMFQNTSHYCPHILLKLLNFLLCVLIV